MGGDQGMVTTEQQVPGRASVAQRWLARLALVAAAAAVLVPLAAIGFGASVALVLVGLAGMALAAAGVWWALTHKGLVRGLAVALAVLAPLVVLILYTSRGLLWVVLVAIGLLGVAVAVGRAALRGDPVPEQMPEQDAPPPRRPYLIMNPRSGGGKVARFALKDKAEALGATVALLEGPEIMDVGALARQAIADGADLLGVAGGDGTQALVAGIAAEHDVPLLVISAGTRNHFALDLGLDREDPSRCLDALGDGGVELRVDLGVIAGRPFVNNASFGAYAAVVQSPAYRDDKRAHHDRDAPRSAGRPARAAAGGQGRERDRPGPPGGAGLQQRLWDGRHRRARAPGPAGPRHPGDVRGHRQSAAQAAGLLRGSRSRGLTSLAGREVVIDADTAQIPVGVDGEALQLDTPVRCTIEPAGPAGPGPPRPPRGTRRQTADQLAPPVAARPDRARYRSWVTAPDPRGRRRPRPSTVASWASSTRSTRPSTAPSRQGDDRAVPGLCDRLTWRCLVGRWPDEAERSAGHA